MDACTEVVAEKPCEAETVGGLKLQEERLGSPEQAKVMMAGNGLPVIFGVMVRTEVPDEPGATGVGTTAAALMVKSVPTPKATVLLVMPFAVTLIFCVPEFAVVAMAKVAVIEVLLTTVTLETVMPALATLMTVPVPWDEKFVPVSVTERLVLPSVPPVGEIAVSVGGGALTVNVWQGGHGVVSPLWVTTTSCGPMVALLAMTKLAVMVVKFWTTTLLGVMPVLPGKLMVAGLPTSKFVPVRVTRAVVPCTPLLGEMPVRVGGPTTLKLTVPLAPALVITLMLSVWISAFPAMVNVAVMLVGLTTVRLETVKPEGTMMDAPEMKLPPVSVTFTVPPCAPMAGEMDDRLGGP